MVVASFRRSAKVPSRAREAVVATNDATHALEGEFEDWDGQGIEVDEANHVIRNVKIIGNKAKNFGREYPQHVLEAHAKKYEDKQSNFNHIKKGEVHRDLNNRMAWVDNIGSRAGKGGLFGDWHYNPENPHAKEVVWWAKNKPSMLGLSPDHIFYEVDDKGNRISGKDTRYRGPRTVTEILHVNSVDVVADPSTTNSIFEATNMNMNEPIVPAPDGDDMNSTDHLKEHCCKMVEEALDGITDPEKLRKASSKIEAMLAKIMAGKEEEEAEVVTPPKVPEKEKEMISKEEKEALAIKNDPIIKKLLADNDAHHVREAAAVQELATIKAVERKKIDDAAKAVKAGTRCMEAVGAKERPIWATDFFIGEMVESPETKWPAMIEDRKLLVAGRHRGAASHARESVEFGGGGGPKPAEPTKPLTLEERKAAVAQLTKSIMGGKR